MFRILKNVLLLLSCCLLLEACGNNREEKETAGSVSPAPTAEGGFSQKMDVGGQIGDALPLTGKVFGELPAVGEEDPVYCNLPENVRGWEDIIPICADPLYGILYYVDYGGDYKIHAIYNGESQTVLELPGKRLFCRGGKLYFLLESYNRVGFEGAKSGNITEYDPVTGEVRILSDKIFSSIVVYQDMIFCKCQGKEKELQEGQEIYTEEASYWFYFFDTGELAAKKEEERKYVLDFRRYGEYFLAAALREYEQDPRYDVQAGTELRKWDGEEGTVWADLMLRPSDRYYVKEGNFCWLDSEGFHQWDPVSGEDTVRPWKIGGTEHYILAGDWLLGKNFRLVNTAEGKTEEWVSADEKLELIDELYTDGEEIYAIVGLFDHEMENGSVFRRVRVMKEEMGYKLQFESVKK